MAASLNGQKPKLKYLFVATFLDGRVIKQNLEDKSSVVETKSMFYDVLSYEEVSPLISFEMQEQGVFGIIANRFSVDLVTGKFKVNDLEFDIADQDFIPQTALKIVFFRETFMEQDVSQKTHQVVGQRLYVGRYFIGWQTTWRNENYQRTIAISG